MPIPQENPIKYNVGDLSISPPAIVRPIKTYYSDLILDETGSLKYEADPPKIDSILELLDYPMQPGESIYLGLDGDPKFGDHPVAEILNDSVEQMAFGVGPLEMANWYVGIFGEAEDGVLAGGIGSGILKEEDGVLRFQTVEHVAKGIVEHTDGRLIIGVPNIGYYLVNPNWYKTQDFSNEREGDNAFYYFDLQGTLLSNMLWEVEQGNLKPYKEVAELPKDYEAYYYRPDMGMFVPPLFKGINSNDEGEFLLEFYMNYKDYPVCSGMSGGAVVFNGEDGKPTGEFFGQLVAISMGDPSYAEGVESGGLTGRNCSLKSYAVAANPEWARDGKPVVTNKGPFPVEKPEQK